MGNGTLGSWGAQLQAGEGRPVDLTGGLLPALVQGRNKQVDFDVGPHPYQVEHMQQPGLDAERRI